MPLCKETRRVLISSLTIKLTILWKVLWCHCSRKDRICTLYLLTAYIFSILLHYNLLQYLFRRWHTSYYVWPLTSPSSMHMRQIFTGYGKVLIWLIIRGTTHEHRLSILPMFPLLDHLSLYRKVTSTKLKTQLKNHRHLLYNPVCLLINHCFIHTQLSLWQSPIHAQFIC
jgi:hypothetical protein